MFTVEYHTVYVISLHYNMCTRYYNILGKMVKNTAMGKYNTECPTTQTCRCYVYLWY